MVVVAVTWRQIYAPDGPLNDALRSVGLDALARGWLGDADLALLAVGLVGTWVGTGLCTVLFLAGMPRIRASSTRRPGSTAPASSGSSSPSACPAVRGEIAVALTLTMVAALRTFDLVYVTTGGGPGNATTRSVVRGLPPGVRARARSASAAAIGVVPHRGDPGRDLAGQPVVGGRRHRHEDLAGRAHGQLRDPGAGFAVARALPDRTDPRDGRAARRRRRPRPAWTWATSPRPGRGPVRQLPAHQRDRHGLRGAGRRRCCRR